MNTRPPIIVVANEAMQRDVRKALSGTNADVVIVDDLSALERRVESDITERIQSNIYNLNEVPALPRKATKSKLFASPYGPQKGRKR